MARTLVVCCDGTWNTASDATNVARFHDALAETPEQVRHYAPGVGTSGNPLSRLVDAAVGSGLSERIREAYRWIAEHWEPGDRLVLIGFSRGAFTVRSLAGMLARCGLVVLDGDDAARERLVADVFDRGYRRREPLGDLAFRPGFSPADAAPIAFLGVWDTVGALGVPSTFGLLSDLFGRAGVRFHDLTLEPAVRHARQALAADERRGPYVPAVWATPAPGTHESFAQQWFPGGHGDVGGGDPRRDLADLALRWMATEATRTVGLRWTSDDPFSPGDPCAPDDVDPRGVWRVLSPRPRTVPHLVDGAPEASTAVLDRRRCGLVPPYRPGRVLAVGEGADAVVPADRTWPATGLYLSPGRYRVAASGSWSDHGASTPPTGFARWPVRTWPFYATSWALELVRRGIRAVSTRRADVVGSRRVLTARRMELVVAVAADDLRGDGTLVESPAEPLGPAGTRELDVPRGGYLYAFANDSWLGYGSNAGAVVLTVDRLA